MKNQYFLESCQGAQLGFNIAPMNILTHPLAFEVFEKLFAEKMQASSTPEDPAHDFLHLQRVVATAKNLAAQENAKLEVVLPAAWFHDFVVIPKDSPQRKQASQISAQAALLYLKEIGYPELYFKDIAHAIEAHSFSAQIEPQTLEAAIVQDADRLDGLGAIGIARCFATSGLLKRPFYSAQDPFCETRTPNDAVFTVDHFFAKLFLVAKTLKTKTALAEGQKRAQHMRQFLDQLQKEL